MFPVQTCDPRNFAGNFWMPNCKRNAHYPKLMKEYFLSILIICQISALQSAEPPEFEWHEKEIDTIEIGYGLQLTDVNGDGKTDIVLADKKTIQWYENPTWTKHVIAKNLTLRDNVCITARDIDGDGKCEIAVGGQWNFKETQKDGAIFYLVPPEDRTQPWKAVKIPNEPNTHRMHWMRGIADDYTLVVKPLRGRGSVDGVGPGLKMLEYAKPLDPTSEWTTILVNDFLHLSHNFHPVNWDDDEAEELITASKEGVWHFDWYFNKWKGRQLTKDFAGEVRDGKLPNGKRFIATVEPMHGTRSAVYVEPESGDGLWKRIAVLDDALVDGHAVACADYLGIGSDQIVVGWRAMHPKGTPGIKLFTPLNEDGTKWRETKISGEQLAVEDIKAADLNGDGKTDFVAAARQTKNLKIFFSGPKGKQAGIYDLPANEAGLPGEGALRRYDGYVKRWPEFRAKWAKQVEADQNAIVFLGDSITQGWGAEFKGLFPGMKLANRGIGGDTTRGMLIRLKEDVLSLNPKAIVILAGTNDLEVQIDPQAIGRNFELILAGIRAHDPEVPVIVCKVFPSSAKMKRPSDKIKKVNERFTQAVKADPHVTLLDTWTLFVDKKTDDADPQWFRDMLHVNGEGYKKWADLLRPVFAKLEGK